ncbi:MAG TPA: hypothetical protein VLI04_10020 [Nocardioidaceae bacterium]|nr:hypothetical protein [Nocardioidaceae bacterium]
MKKFLIAGAFAMVATFATPLAAQAGELGTCDAGDQAQETLDVAAWQKKDRNANGWVCVKTRLGKDGLPAGWRMYDDTI